MKTSYRPEDGQVLTLFALLLGALFLCVMAVVDVGFFLHERQQVQTAADAAALAGAQELPDDADLAEQIALEYVEAHGIDPNTVDISFKCTTESDVICNESEGVYDTIVVTPTSTAPSFFGGILNLFGQGDSCWVDGCDADATAGACRGACGGLGNGPVDVAVILDHSGSMSDSELDNAQDAILAMFENFNHEFQQVATVMTPPVETSDYCEPIDDWDDPQIWMTSGLTDQFQSSPHVLDYSNAAVDSIDCVERGGPFSYGGHTNLGDPIQVAMDELIANGRPDVTWGIILVTDGAANVAPATSSTNSTGMHICGNEAPVTTGSGDNDGYESSASDICDDDWWDDDARDSNSGTSTSMSCSSSNKDRHDFFEFGLYNDIPDGATIDGIEVELEATVNADWNDDTELCVELSWDGGSSWTDYVNFNIYESYYLQDYNVGGSSSTWGRTWTRDDFTDSNFRVRVTNVDDDWGNDTDFYLNDLMVEVFYSTDEETYEHTGPCDYAAYWADQAKAAGIELYTIAWGAYDECDDEDWGSTYDDMDSDDFLESLATDSSHFFNEPKTADLEPIFYTIGSQLTSGSRLVQ